MTKKDTEALNKALNNIKEWRDGLSASQKKKTAIFLLVGDMKGGNNYEYIIGSEENTAMTLAQTMLGHKDSYTIMKKAIELVEKYVELDEKEQKERNKGKKPKILAS